MYMINRVSLRVFLYCLFTCASLVLIFIWAGGPPAQIWFQIAASLFVLGLTAFLVWFSLSLLEFRNYFKQS